MINSFILNDPAAFSTALFEKMRYINPALDALEPYEFRYCLNNLIPEPGGWASVKPDSRDEIERRVNDTAFFKSIQIKAKVETITPSDPITVARLVSTTQLNRAGMVGSSGRSLRTNLIP